MSEPVTAYKASCCGKVFGTLWEVAAHEKTHGPQVQAQQEATERYQKKFEATKTAAYEYGKSSEVLALLLRHGFEEEARIIARDKMWDVSTWECGSSSGQEEIYAAMLAGAREGQEGATK